MQKEIIKFSESCVFEGMTSIRSIISAIDNLVSDRRIERIFYDKARYSAIYKHLGYLRAVKDRYGFEILESTASELDGLTVGNSHGGIIALCSERHIPLLYSESIIKPNGLYVMIQGIEDPYNFGYALRSLYACGVDGIILSPRNWMSAAGVVCRSSAGASELFDMKLAESIESTISIFKSNGYSIVCADERTDNVLGKIPLPLPILLIIGGEKRGISRAVIDLCDIRVKIAYALEFNASLSAASAATMFAYEIARQNSIK